MNFERKVIETLKDDNGNEIVEGDSVVYTINNKPQSFLAVFKGIEKGYMIFQGNPDSVYTVLPRTIETMFKANTDKLFVLPEKVEG